jgi:hypothetical protein
LKENEEEVDKLLGQAGASTLIYTSFLRIASVRLYYYQAKDWKSGGIEELLDVFTRCYEE